MKIEDLRRQKPCYIHNLHVGDTFLLEGELYYIYSCNNAEQIIHTINLTSNSVQLFDSRFSQNITPVKGKVCILEDEQF